MNKLILIIIGCVLFVSNAAACKCSTDPERTYERAAHVMVVTFNKFELIERFRPSDYPQGRRASAASYEIVEHLKGGTPPEKIYFDIDSNCAENPAFQGEWLVYVYEKSLSSRCSLFQVSSRFRGIERGLNYLEYARELSANGV